MSSVDELFDNLRRHAYEGIATALARVNRDQLEQVLCSRTNHPLRWMLKGLPKPGSLQQQVLCNTEISIKTIIHWRLEEWLKSRMNEACALPESNAESYDTLAIAYKALAEIRAVGYLLRCSFGVTPRSGKGFDLLIKTAEKEIAVEVSAVRISKNEANQLDHFLCKRSVCCEKDIYPAGQPKPGELSVDNIAHKFSQKAEEENSQLPCDFPSLIWLDLQFEDWWSLSEEEAWPLYVLSNGRFRTGGVWLAFYGLKGVSLIDGESMFEGLPRSARGIRHESMRYDGYFYRPHARASGVIIAWPRCTVLYENPRAPSQLPKPVLQRLCTLLYFDWPRSWLRPFWKDSAITHLGQWVEEMWETINSVAKLAYLDW